VNDALPPVPRKRDALMLESPSKTLPISYVGPNSRPLPPISAPSGEHTSHIVSPRGSKTAPGKTRDYGKSSSRSRSVPPVSVEESHLAQNEHPAHHSVPTDKPIPASRKDEGKVKTTAETTVNEKTSTTREHQQTGTINADDGFFLTQV